MVLKLSTSLYIVTSVFAAVVQLLFNDIVRSVGIQAEQALAVGLQVAEQEAVSHDDSCLGRFGKRRRKRKDALK